MWLWLLIVIVLLLNVFAIIIVRSGSRCIAFAIVGLLWFATSAAAQTTCPPSNSGVTIRSTAPITLQFCSAQTATQANADGTTTNVAVTIVGANVYGIPSAAKIQLGSFARVAGPFADGTYQYQGTFPAPPKGSYTITARTLYTVPADPTQYESNVSASFAFVVADPPSLAAPTNLRTK